MLYDFGGIGAARKGAQEQEGGGSPFDMFFGGGGGREQSNRGRNTEIDLPVTLEDLCAGERAEREPRGSREMRPRGRPRDAAERGEP